MSTHTTDEASGYRIVFVPAGPGTRSRSRDDAGRGRNRPGSWAARVGLLDFCRDLGALRRLGRAFTDNLAEVTDTR